MSDYGKSVALASCVDALHYVTEFHNQYEIIFLNILCAKQKFSNFYRL